MTPLYPKGIKVSDNDMQTLEATGIVTRDDFHGEWNYTLHPHPGDTPTRNRLINHEPLGQAWVPRRRVCRGSTCGR